MELKEAYSTNELSSLVGKNISTIIRQAQREGWKSRNREGRGGGYEWLAASLPADVKAALVLKVAGESPAAPKSGGMAVPEWSHEIGRARYRITAEWRAFTKKKKQMKSEATAAFLTAYNGGKLLPEEFERIGSIQVKTLYRWDKLLRDNEEDYLCLCDGRGAWKRGGAKGLGQIGAKAEEAFLSCWLTPNKPSIHLAWLAMSAILEGMGEPVPSEASTRRFAKRFDQAHHDLVVLKREGEKALNDTVSSYIKRNSKILEVGDCLFCDGHVLNFTCLHPQTGRPFRPTLIAWFDWKSSLPVGWEIMPTENTVAISSALKMAVANLGKYPKVAYLDNGRAFKAKYFLAETDLKSLEGLYSRLGIAVQFAKPYHGQSKVVERFFGTFNEQCQRLLPSYCGNSIADKPAWLMRNEKYHRARHEKEDFVPTLREAAEIFRLYVNWYGRQPHPQFRKESHFDVFSAGRGDGVNLTELERFFMWTKVVHPRRCGFTLAGVWYESESLYRLNMEIQVKYSWADLSEVYLYDMQGRRLGVARPQEELHPLARHFGDDLDQEKVREANRRIAAMKASTLRVAREMDRTIDSPGLTALPYYPERKEPQKKAKLEDEPEQLSEEERLRLERVIEEAKTAPQDLVKRPEFFVSDWERYEWAFMTIYRDEQSVSEEDLAFMARFEQTEDFLESRGRYDQLQVAFARQKECGR